MAKFVFKSVIFALIFIILVLMVNISRPKTKFSNDYMAAIIDKHKLLDEIQPPRILLAGGSNITFGIDSDMLEEEFGLPVIDLALHIELGLEFIANELKYSAKNQDIVFLSIEYPMSIKGDYKLKKHTAELFKEASKYYHHNYLDEIQLYYKLSKDNLKSIFLSRWTKSYIDTTSNIVYSRDSFNKHGDEIGHLYNRFPKTTLDHGNINYEDTDRTKLLNDLYHSLNEKGVKLFFLFPTLANSEYVKHKIEIGNFYKDFKNNLEFEILNTPSDFVFDDSLFYDTIYHLNAEGREMRTEKLIDIIKNHKNQLYQQNPNLLNVLFLD